MLPHRCSSAMGPGHAACPRGVPTASRPPTEHSTAVFHELQRGRPGTPDSAVESQEGPRGRWVHREPGCTGCALCSSLGPRARALLSASHTAPCEVLRQPSLCKTGAGGRDAPYSHPWLRKVNFLLAVATSLTLKAGVVLVFTLIGPLAPQARLRYTQRFSPRRGQCHCNPSEGGGPLGQGVRGPETCVLSWPPAPRGFLSRTCPAHLLPL